MANQESKDGTGNDKPENNGTGNDKPENND